MNCAGGRSGLWALLRKLEGPSSSDKSQRAALSDIVFTDRDPRSKNLPISLSGGYQNDIIHAIADCVVSYDRRHEFPEFFSMLKRFSEMLL